MNRSSQPSLSRSRKSTPMEESALPSSLRPTPACRAASRKRPLRSLWKRKFGHGVVGDEDVHPAVVVVIGDGDAHAFAAMGGDSGSGGDVGERAVAVVVIEAVGQGLVEARVAIGANAARGIAAERLARPGPT